MVVPRIFTAKNQSRFIRKRVTKKQFSCDLRNKNKGSSKRTITIRGKYPRFIKRNPQCQVTL